MRHREAPKDQKRRLIIRHVVALTIATVSFPRTRESIPTDLDSRVRGNDKAKYFGVHALRIAESSPFSAIAIMQTI